MEDSNAFRDHVSDPGVYFGSEGEVHVEIGPSRDRSPDASSCFSPDTAPSGRCHDNYRVESGSGCSVPEQLSGELGYEEALDVKLTPRSAGREWPSSKENNNSDAYDAGYRLSLNDGQVRDLCAELSKVNLDISEENRNVDFQAKDTHRTKHKSEFFQYGKDIPGLERQHSGNMTDHLVEPFSSDFLDGNMARVYSWVSGLDVSEFETGEEHGLAEETPLPESLEVSANPLDLVPSTNESHSVALALESADKRTHSISLTSQSLKVIPSLGLFQSLKYLSLANNSIASISPGLLPRSLHSLDLSRNSLIAVEGLKDLTRLRILKISHNRITRIGHGLSSCTSLRELFMADNKISEVEGLHRLLKLTVLDLSHNKLSTTKSLSQLAANYVSLQVFSVMGNPVTVNLGLDTLNKYIRGLLPHLIQLNEQHLKTQTMKENNGEGTSRTSAASGLLGVTARMKSSARPSARVSKGASKARPAVPSGEVVRGRTLRHHADQLQSRSRRAAVDVSGARKSSSRSLPSSGKMEPVEVDFSSRPA